jgi:hypothetical protein
VPTTPIEVTMGCPLYATCCRPWAVRKMLGIFASAVEFGTMPTIRNTWAPTCRVSPMCRPSTLDAATSSGNDGTWPSETRGMPGPCSGAPKAVTFRVDAPCFMIVPTQASGAAATTPGSAAMRARSTSGKGVEPRNGPAAPALTTNASTPRESTVSRASTRKPFMSPVMTRVIPKISAVLTIAIVRRLFRHCMSRKAAKSIPRTYQRPHLPGPRFGYARRALISAKSH